MRESQDPGRNVDHVSDESELPQQPSQTSGQENNVAPVSQPDVLMLDPGSPETLDKSAETSDDDPLLNLSRTAAVHTGNGDQSTKCLLSRTW